MDISPPPECAEDLRDIEIDFDAIPRYLLNNLFEGMKHALDVYYHRTGDAKSPERKENA